MPPSTPSQRRSSKPAAATVAGRVTSWLTAAERSLLDGTVGRSLAEASQKRLQALLARSRTLRDKWRDLFNRQTKSTKRTTRRGDPVNTRSLDKAELFAAAVRRLEARLGELAEGVSAAVGGAVRKASARPGKASRRAGHRATRATVREVLASSVATANAAARRAAARATAAVVGGAEEKTTRSASGSSRPAGSKPAKKARQAGKRRALAASGTGQAIGFDPRKQRSAKASATAARIRLDGLTTRRRGHTLAAGRRKQARRDGR